MENKTMKKTYIEPLSKKLTVVSEELLDEELPVVSDPDDAVKPGEEDDIEANETSIWDSVW